ncbi:MAG: hypothetical protein CDV28_14613 [Candidatus Electronema aureum]|uniref:Uncharacterized protein n=1 Tax=Candidatus Electronema aureum TaxID=2005002 RepID=A0A521FZ02_9BACT|nr:MAG: hypothetical protein CDV28_14613 [Candidatus Electronema aureum]
MKKVLVAGTALMLAGSFVVQAQAEVNPKDEPRILSGDARVSYIGKQDYLRNANSANGYDDYFESRVGVNFDSTAWGKATQGVSAKARLYFDGYGFEDDAPWNGQESTQVSVDYAYLTAPLGDWTIKAGRVNPNYSQFFSWNIRPTRLIANYKQGNVDITPFVGVRAEASTEDDVWNDNDYMEYGLVAGVKLQNAWNLKGYVRYDDDKREWDQTTKDLGMLAQDADGNSYVLVAPKVPIYDTFTPHNDRSGVIADVFLNNDDARCDFGFHAELAYKSADVQGTEDDGLGGYVQLSKKMSDQFTPIVLAGMTKDGYVADNDFGFVMVGGETSTQVLKVGEGGDLLFGALVAKYVVSDSLTLTGNLLYADFDNDAAGTLDSAIEVSGIAAYALNDSASLTYKAGYLTPSITSGSGVDEDAYFAHLVRLNIAF